MLRLLLRLRRLFPHSLLLHPLCSRYLRLVSSAVLPVLLLVLLLALPQLSELLSVLPPFRI